MAQRTAIESAAADRPHLHSFGADADSDNSENNTVPQGSRDDITVPKSPVRVAAKKRGRKSLIQGTSPGRS